MAWITPIINWIAANVVKPSDFNRIEGNIAHLNDNKVENSRVLTDVPLGAKFTETTINGKTGAISKADIVALGIPAQDTNTTYGQVTTSADGLMIAADKVKLNNIAAGAQVNAVTSVAGRTGAVTLAKGDVGLGSVENYGIATQAEAQAGTVNNKYMTPLRVKEATEKLIKLVTAGGNPILNFYGNNPYSSLNSWRKVGEVKLGLVGSIRVKLEGGNANAYGYMMVGRNNTRIGAQSNAAATGVVLVQDLSGWNVGDTIELWLYQTFTKYETDFNASLFVGIADIPLVPYRQTTASYNNPYYAITL